MGADFSIAVRFYRLSEALQPYFTALYQFDIDCPAGVPWSTITSIPNGRRCASPQGRSPIACVGSGRAGPAMAVRRQRADQQVDPLRRHHVADLGPRAAAGGMGEVRRRAARATSPTGPSMARQERPSASSRRSSDMTRDLPAPPDADRPAGSTTT